ncbi:hypothetical protein SAMN04489806_1718 [Paramicrobacterium humi]|uniref:PKD domain-containing protein n=1 Tax=Paramicrobacterium humi TaxID=640635 RepID=A0A1H4M0B6_9MICO|nr:PKD domain-containing protein [Microbacterium humi]SEB76479.1 hypothetical protein SAMN04489806_1718 [Microbacterium humi]
MARNRLLRLAFSAALGLAALLPGVVPSVPTAISANTCTVWQSRHGGCVDSGIDGDHVDIGGTKTKPGNGGGSHRGNGGNGGDSNVPKNPLDEDGDGNDDWLVGPCRRYTYLCINNQPVTMTDLASFTPATVHIAMEPDGWMIIGLPANFIADASTNATSGALFDTAIDVRFTPVSYTWSWGDGSSSTSRTGGASWADLGVDEFTPTSTSHAYAEKGAYTISLAVHYAVDIRGEGTAWQTVDGQLTKAAISITAIATTANSVIVDKECSKNPSGPGC